MTATRSQQTVGWLAFLLMAATSAAVPLTAQSEPRPAVEAASAPDRWVARSIAGGRLVLVPRVSWDRAVLRLGRPTKQVSRHTFESGQPIEVDLAGPEGELPPEGKYAYELRLVASDGSGWKVESGNFRLGHGSAASGQAPIGGFGLSGDPPPNRRGPITNHDADEIIVISDANGNGFTHLETRSTGSNSWQFRNQAGILHLRQLTNLTFPDLTVTPYPGLGAAWVGIGTSIPRSSLELLDDGFSPALRITDEANGYSARLVVESETGAVILENGLTPRIRITQAGTVQILANLSVSSSRELKHRLEPVLGDLVLDRLDGLEILEWEFRDGPEGVRHVGPSAEQFHEIFGLGGDERLLSPTDLGGIALAAVKELRREIDERQREIERLRAARSRDLAAFAEQLDRLRHRVDALTKAEDPACAWAADGASPSASVGDHRPGA